MKTHPAHIHHCQDGSVLVEVAGDKTGGFRLGFVIDVAESSWYIAKFSPEFGDAYGDFSLVDLKKLKEKLLILLKQIESVE